jgi:hypothetical protein
MLLRGDTLAATGTGTIDVRPSPEVAWATGRRGFLGRPPAPVAARRDRVGAGTAGVTRARPFGRRGRGRRPAAPGRTGPAGVRPSSSTPRN